MTGHHRRLLFKKWSRALHIYLSMLGLVMILFFAATGFILNHDDWFGLATSQTTQSEGQVPVALLAAPDKLGLVEKLRADFRVAGALDSFDVQEDQLSLAFKSPARRVEVSVDRKTGHVALTRESHGAVARLADLHKGTDAGPAWRLVIDLTALMLVISCVTGIVLWLLVPKWRPLGLAAVLVCTVVCAAIYFFLVP